MDARFTIMNGGFAGKIIVTIAGGCEKARHGNNDTGGYHVHLPKILPFSLGFQASLVAVPFPVVTCWDSVHKKTSRHSPPHHSPPCELPDAQRKINVELTAPAKWEEPAAQDARSCA